MHKHPFHVHQLTPLTYRKATVWTLIAAMLVVACAAALGRAAHNFRAALTDKPDVAIYLLLKQKNIGNTTLLRQSDTERDYLAETKDGPELVKLQKGKEEWYIASDEPLHE